MVDGKNVMSSKSMQVDIVLHAFVPYYQMKKRDSIELDSSHIMISCLFCRFEYPYVSFHFNVIIIRITCKTCSII